jgi:hypothetical protein
MATGRRDQTAMAEATTSMTADLQLADSGATAPTIGTEEPPPPPPTAPPPPSDDGSTPP